MEAALGQQLSLGGGGEREAAVAQLHAATAIYTREPVVEELLGAVAWPGGGRRLVDPSCGDGAFLGAALQRLLRQAPLAGAGDVVGELEGWEVHPGAAEAARARLREVLVAHGWMVSDARAVASRVVRLGDFLTEGPSSPVYDVVAGNPPYLRFLNVPALLRAEYEAVLPAHARTDLLHSFLARCAVALRPGGEVALVTADRWLFNEGAARLRAALGQHLALHGLRRLDPRTAFYRPKTRRAGTPPRIHPVAVILRNRVEGGTALTAEPIYPDRHGSRAEEGPTLGEVAKVSLAPWLGPLGVFLVSEAQAAGLPRECLVPAIDTDDIREGRVGRPTRYALRTIPTTPPPPAVMAHLEASGGGLTPRARRRVPWMPPESWHHRDLSAPCLLVPRIARSLRPVRVPAGVLPVNHNLSIVAAGDASLEEIEAVLMSEEADAWARDHAARLEGGFYSLTTTLLRRLPFRR